MLTPITITAKASAKADLAHSAAISAAVKAGKKAPNRAVVKKKIKMNPDNVSIVFVDVARYIITQGGSLPLHSPDGVDLSEEDKKKKAQAFKKVNNRVTKIRVMVQIALSFKEEAHAICRKLFDDPKVIFTTFSLYQILFFQCLAQYITP
jgi:hypothetical protein